MKLFIEELGVVATNDIVRMFVGQPLGSGCHRSVFAHGQDSSLVVKLESGCGTFANPQEWEVWQRVCDTAFARWFAPCLAISGCGAALIQRRTTPVPIETLEAELPSVPAFFTDLKVGNWGRLDGRLVCHDYGNHLLYERGMTTRMRKAKWWETLP
ncbi:MAG: hypothetical protein NVV63_12635 [Opitutus sp.]|nr:hypothetical protein [Opitutus sp.]